MLVNYEEGWTCTCECKWIKKGNRKRAWEGSKSRGNHWVTAMGVWGLDARLYINRLVIRLCRETDRGDRKTAEDWLRHICILSFWQRGFSEADTCCIKLQVLSPQNDACRLQGWLYDLDVDVVFLSCWVKGSSACMHGNSDKHESSWKHPKLPPASLLCFCKSSFAKIIFLFIAQVVFLPWECNASSIYVFLILIIHVNASFGSTKFYHSTLGFSGLHVIH